MPRPPRLHLPGALTVITSKGVSSEQLFRDQQDCDTYLALVAEYRRRHHVKLFAYCLLPDAVHLCVEMGGSATVSALMHDLTSRYTKYFNHRYQRAGHLFQSRFKSALAEKAITLLPLTAALHRYPVQQGLCASAVEYPYSSARLYRMSEPMGALDLRAELQEVLALVASGHAPEDYERYVMQLSTQELEDINAGLRRGRLGSPAFLEAVETQLQEGGRFSFAPAGKDREPSPVSAAGRGPRLRFFREPMIATLMVVVVVMGLMGAALQKRMAWLEQTVVSLAQENDAAFRARVSTAFAEAPFEIPLALDGTEWDVLVMAPDGRQGVIAEDQLTFTHQQFSSRAMGLQRFSNAPYASTTQPNGTQVWEATQTNPAGVTIRWEAKRQGAKMRGVMIRQEPGQSAQPCAFVGMIRMSTSPSRRAI